MARPRTDIEPRIVAAARTLFLQHGVDGTSLRQIARAAETNVGMIYYYFTTKDDLFLAVVEDVYAGLLGEFARALAPDVAVEQRIRRLFQRIGEATELERQTIQLVFREALLSSARRDRLVDRFRRGHIPLILATLVDGAQDGSVRGDIPPAVLTLATLAGAAMTHVGNRAADIHPAIAELLGSADITDTLVDVLFHGIGAAPRRPSTP